MKILLSILIVILAVILFSFAIQNPKEHKVKAVAAVTASSKDIRLVTVLYNEHQVNEKIFENSDLFNLLISSTQIKWERDSLIIWAKESRYTVVITEVFENSQVEVINIPVEFEYLSNSEPIDIQAIVLFYKQEEEIKCIAKR